MIHSFIRDLQAQRENQKSFLSSHPPKKKMDRKELIDYHTSILQGITREFEETKDRFLIPRIAEHMRIINHIELERYKDELERHFQRYK